MIDINLLVSELETVDNDTKIVVGKMNTINIEDEEYDRYFDIVSLITNKYFENPTLLFVPIKYNDKNNSYWDSITSSKNSDTNFIQISTLEDLTIKGYIDFLKNKLIANGITQISGFYNFSDNLDNISDYIELNNFEIWNDGDNTITLFFY